MNPISARFVPLDTTCGHLVNVVRRLSDVDILRSAARSSRRMSVRNRGFREVGRTRQLSKRIESWC